MFGLDARIALAIFGGLSVITGAALYKVIQQVKVTAVIADLSELSKAYDAYTLDTGLDLDYAADGASRYLEIGELVESSVTGWNGPYTSYAKHPTSLHVSLETQLAKSNLKIFSFLEPER